MSSKWIKIVVIMFACGMFSAGTVQASTKPEYTLAKGKTVTLTAVKNSNRLTAGKSYKITKARSKNSAVVKISGKSMTAVKKGKAVVVMYNKKGKRVTTFTVHVGKPVKKLVLSNRSVSIKLGHTKKISAKIRPANATVKGVTYQSLNRKVAKVSQTGLITTVSTGSTKIVVRSKDGNVKRKISVKVKSNLTRSTEYGKVKGTQLSDGTYVWWGIPYGKAPIGELRWRAPQAPTPWASTLSTTTKRLPAAQVGEDSGEFEGTEDCLYVNVFRPNTAKNNLPVIVYLHGGGNAGGTANRNFKNLANSANAVIVSVEFRQGAFGWLSMSALKTGSLNEDSGNYALLDIEKSLRWVKSNIANFGGNPSNVTLSGFSAGGRNVLLCLISPRFKGLFEKAMVFSGGANTCTNEEGEESALEKLANLLVLRGTYQTTSEAMLWINQASDSQIKRMMYSLSTAEVAQMYSAPALNLTKFPQCFTDGYVIPKEGFSVIASGNYNRVPVILGSNYSEFSKYALMADYVDPNYDVNFLTSGWKMIDLLQQSKYYGSMLMSGLYAERNAEMLLQDPSHKNVFAYRFKWAENTNSSTDFFSTFLGSVHGMDMSFLTGIYTNAYTSYCPNLYNDENLAGRKALTETMQKYVRHFIRTGDPNGTGLKDWYQWSTTAGVDKIMTFSATKSKNTSAMSTQYYQTSEVFTTMKQFLTRTQYNLLTKFVFADRVFMPENVPEY